MSHGRADKTIIEAIRHYVNRRQTDWAAHISRVETVFNNAVNASTKIAPNELVYGTTLRLFPRIIKTESTAPAVSEPLKQIMERIDDTTAIAKDNRLTSETTPIRKSRPGPAVRYLWVGSLPHKNAAPH